MSNTDWILNRLSSVKRNSPAWSQLASALQSTTDSIIEPVISRFTSMRTLFTATDEDLSLAEGDLGDFFRVDRNLKGKDKAVALMGLQDDINYKSTLKPLQDRFSREFKGMSIQWSPLYAHATLADNPYGTSLITEEAIKGAGLSLDDYFLTSRGIVRLNALDVISLGYTLSEFSSLLRKSISELKPVHIVYDGDEMFLLYALTDQPNRSGILVRDIFKEFPATRTSNSYSYDRVINRDFSALVEGLIKPEYFQLDVLPADMYPMDTPLKLYGEIY